jgi:hypothetical protein
MISRLNFRTILLLLLSSQAGQSLAYEMSLSIGQYEPFDGVVNGVYKNDAPSYLLRFAVPRSHGLSWSSTLVYYEFNNRVANLESDVRLTALQTGFRKTFLEKTEPGFGLEPFFGAGAGVVSLQAQAENDVTDRVYSSTAKYGLSTSWEIGTQINSSLMRNVDFEIKMTDLVVGRKLFGNLNMGGRILSMGFQYSIPVEEAH